MKLYKIFVDSKDIDTENGFELLSTDPFIIKTLVEVAIKNGYTDIKIDEALPGDYIEYEKNLGELQ